MNDEYLSTSSRSGRTGEGGEGERVVTHDIISIKYFSRVNNIGSVREGFQSNDRPLPLRHYYFDLPRIISEGCQQGLTGRIGLALSRSRGSKIIKIQNPYAPAASGIRRSLYRSPRKRLFISVDLPRPVSPNTIRVNSKPRFTDFRCTCSGSVAKPI